MADTVADVLIRLGVDTAGLQAGFREARGQTTRFASELARILLPATGGGGGILGAIVTGTGGGGNILGGILRGIGGIFGAIGGFISGWFKGAARRIGKEVSQIFQEILQKFNEGSLKLGEALRQIEREREEAIRRLSGRKGGREQLEKLLPDFDRAIAELRARQQAIYEQFDERLALLRTGAAFRDVAASVREVLRQYQTYVDAGGDLARANEFLSRSLEEIRAQSAIELAEGEEAAIESVLRLNDLLREREALLAESAEEERRILSRGVLERQHTVAQDKAIELQAARRQRDERLAELDQNIRILELQVESESRVFDLARDRIALETRLLELKAQEFDREAGQLAALRDIVAGLIPGAGGLFGLTPVLQQQLNLGGVQIWVGQGATTEQARAVGAEVIEEMLRALLRERARFGAAV